MYLYQYIVMAATCCLFLMPSTKIAFSVLAVSWVTYTILVVFLPGDYYYAAVAGLDLFIGYVLNKRFRVASYLSYSLIFISFFGYYLYVNNLEPFYYNLFYAIIEVFRIASLIARGLLDGVYKNRWRSGRSGFKYLLVCFVDFDSREACVKMLKNTPEKKAER